VLTAGCTHGAAAPTAPPASSSSTSLQLTGGVVGIGHDTQFKAALDTADVTKSSTWSSSDPAVLTVSSTGLVHPVSDGTAVVTANYEGLMATKPVTTVRCISWSITGPKVIWLGQSVVWQTDAYDSCIAHWAGTSASFSSTNTNVLTVDRATLTYAVSITGVAPGTATIQASNPADPSSGLKNATASGTVTVLDSMRPPPERLEITTSTGGTLFWGLVLGASKALKVTAHWTTPIVWDEDVTPSVIWSTSDPAVVGISSSGVITGVKPGSATISASYAGVTGTTTVVVGSDHDSLSANSVDLHADVDPFGRARFNSRVEYTYTLASSDTGTVRLDLWDQATGAHFVSYSNVALKGTGTSVLAGGIVTVPPSITTICGSLSLAPTTLVIDLGCKPAHVTAERDDVR
jgi:hypothetical protein